MAGSATLNVAVLVNAAQASAGLQQVGNKAESVGSKMTKAFAGMVAGAGLVSFAKDAVESLARIEKINAQSAQTIKSTGGAANVSAQHVEDLALSIEALTATEAESVQEGANLLLTFTNIKNEAGQGNDVFDQATQTLTDMSRALGTDVSASAIQLGKALNDPIKGVSALSKVGVSFTGEQKELIRTLVESGDVMGAQKIILGELNKEFGGSGAAYAATAAGQWDMFNDALGDFGMAVMTNVMPALLALMDAATPLLGLLGEMPVEMMAAAGAFALWLAFGSKIGPALTTFKTGLASSVSSMSGFKAGVSSVAKSLSGGLIVAGITVAVMVLADAFTRAGKAADAAEEAFTPAIDAIVENNGKWNDSANEAVDAAVLQSDAFKGLTEAGFTGAEAVKIIMGTQEEWIKVQEGMSAAGRSFTKDTTASVDGMIDQHAQITANAQAQVDGKKALDELSGSTEVNTAAVEGNTAAVELSEDAIKDLETGLKDLQDAQKAAFEATDASHLLDELDRAEQAAERSSKVIEAALESAFPERGKLRATALTDIFDQVAGLSDLIKQEDIGGQIRDIFVDIENQDAMTLSMLGDPGIAVRDWAAKFQTSWDSSLTDTFKRTGGNVEKTIEQTLGNTQTQIQQVADELGISFDDASQIVTASIGQIDEKTLREKVLQITADDQEAFEKVLFYDSIRFDPVTKTFVSDIKIPPVEQIVAEMNAKFGLVPPVPVPVTPGPLDPKAPTIMEQLIAGLPPVPGPPVVPHVDPAPVQKDLGVIAGTTTTTTVDIKGNPKPATSTIAGEVVNPQRQTNPIMVIANSAPARNAIEAFRRDYADLQIMAIVNANTAPARNAVEAFRGAYGGVSVTATILGNSAPARSAISAVENGSYTATIRIVADTSSFLSSFNSLPGTKPITLQQQRAPSFAAPALAVTPAASGAPSASTNLGTASVVINVSGAIDPDSTARQIQQLLERRGRRSGAISI